MMIFYGWLDSGGDFKRNYHMWLKDKIKPKKEGWTRWEEFEAELEADELSPVD
jgi:hypothetical protein